MSVLDPKSVSQVTNPVEQRLLMAMADQEVDVADSIREWLRDGYDAWCSTAMRIAAAIDSGPSRNTAVGEAWRDWLSLEVDEANWHRVLQAALHSLPSRKQGKDSTTGQELEHSRLESD